MSYLKRVLGLSLALLGLVLRAEAAEFQSPAVISLAGEWRLSLGSPEASFPQAALPALHFQDCIELPGTTETRGKGPLFDGVETGGLTRVRKFAGCVWYERDVQIPAAWAGKRIRLFLERSKLTQVWVDGKACGSKILFSAPQVYDLSEKLSPGAHRLTILVDNRLKHWPLQTEVHAYSDGTVTNWNGLIGRLELEATAQVWLEDVQAYPKFAERSFWVKTRVDNRLGKRARVTLKLAAQSFNHEGPAHEVAPVSKTLDVPAGGGVFELELPLGVDARLWDEFSPNLYRLTLALTSESGLERRELDTGLRDFRTKNGQFTINGRTTFLRGKHDACVFPLTGHPPMDLESWMKFMGKLRDYGINHFRCHTWIPPQAAFAAADRLGIYVEPETPYWGTFDAKVRDTLMPEAEAALREYGNHPSFAMMTLGNEMGGDRQLMNAMVVALRALDSRHLYSDGANNVLWEPRLQPTNDFWISAKIINEHTNNKPVPARGSFCVFDGDEGHVQWGPSNTRADLGKAVAGVPIPVIGHETGQWTSYPNYSEIGKYTGVLRAKNLERFRDSLARNGMLEQAPDFNRASGALAAQLYREENELALRTPGFGGFQLLDLQDYPGQGTALVGMLDAFMDSKGFITPEQWKRSCDTIVPIARFDRYTWRQDESYVADIEVAHYGRADLKAATVRWTVQDQDGAVFAEGKLGVMDIQQGGVRKLGRVELPLAAAKVPGRFQLLVTIEAGSEKRMNDWPLWVYPAKSDWSVPTGVSMVRRFDATAKALLAEGRRVVLMPEDSNWANTMRGAYATDYWCWPMFNNTPGTMGLLCQEKHPALANFPTRFHSERQWANMAHVSSPVILTPLAGKLRPIVQVIDNLERNEKLGLIFEARVGKGALLVCAVNLEAQKDKPEAGQLFASLMRYAASEAFSPTEPLSPENLDLVLRPSLANQRPIKASSFFQPPWGAVPAPERAVDGDICTRWIAKGEDKQPTLTVELSAPSKIDRVELVWENDVSGYAYVLESSEDGGTWTQLADRRQNDEKRGRHLVPVSAAKARFVRLTATAHPAGMRFCLREFRVLGESLKP